MTQVAEKTPKSDDVHESSKGTNHGYIVEWRGVGGVKIMAPIDQVYPREEWGQAPYDIKKMRLDGNAMTLVRPVISHWDDVLSPHSLSAHGLVSILVAEAIIACLKTLVVAHPELDPLADCIEFRARHCKLTFDWKVTKDPMDEDSDGSPSDPIPEGQKDA